jgi:hypothetical protein
LTPSLENSESHDPQSSVPPSSTGGARANGEDDDEDESEEEAEEDDEDEEDVVGMAMHGEEWDEEERMTTVQEGDVIYLELRRPRLGASIPPHIHGHQLSSSCILTVVVSVAMLALWVW